MLSGESDVNAGFTYDRNKVMIARIFHDYSDDTPKEVEIYSVKSVKYSRINKPRPDEKPIIGKGHVTARLTLVFEIPQFDFIRPHARLKMDDHEILLFETDVATLVDEKTGAIVEEFVTKLCDKVIDLGNQQIAFGTVKKTKKN